MHGKRLLNDTWRGEIRQEVLHPSVLLDTFWKDIRFGCRLTRRNPLFASIVVLMLTVGIGINASVFTVVNHLALLQHVSKDPASFVRITPVARWRASPRSVSSQEYGKLRDQSRIVRPLAAIAYIPVVVGDGDTAERAGLAASCNFFAAEGLDRPALGRIFVRDDAGSARDAVG